MSKEIAQTVGGKKFGLMLALLAALAVVATLGSQWRGASADATSLNCVAIDGTTDQQPAGTVQTFSAGDTVTCTVTTSSAATGGVSWTVTGNNSGAITPSASTTANATSNTVTFTIPAADTSVAVAYAFSDGNGAHPATQPNQTNTLASVGATGTGATGAIGTDITVTFSLPANTTGQSDPTKGTGGNNTRVVTAADVTGCSTNCSVQSVTVAAPADEALAGNVTVVVRPTVVGTYNIGLLLTNTQGTSGGTDDVNFASGTAAAVAVQPYLRHMGGSGDNTVVTVQDVYNNVRGSRHVVCVTDGQDTATGGAHGVVIPLSQANQILIENGGGYETPGDQVQTFSDPQFFTKTVNGSLATCFSWVSTGAGDQQLVATYPNVNGGVVTVNWGGTAVNKSLVKEWNVLESSTVSGAGVATGGAGTPNVGYSVTRGLTLNPASGLHTFTPIKLDDQFTGSHVTAAGSTALAGGGSTAGINLAGVAWNVYLAAGSCGTLTDLSGTATALSPAELAALGGAVMGFKGVTYNTWDALNNKLVVAGIPSVQFNPGSNASRDCLASSTGTVVFTGTESGPIASGPGNTVKQTVLITFVQPIPVKQVLLAWAGQRVLIEHDWRIPPGDSAGGGPAGLCPFNVGQTFAFVRGAGSPGNFIPALGGVINGNDEIDVSLQDAYQGGPIAGSDQTSVTVNGQTGPGDATLRPQGACITRAQYESEDPGEVDIEIFPTGSQVGGTEPANGNPVTGVGKVAVVVYYMKLNTVTLSLATQVSKPSHNGLMTNPDWAPGNPWDATKDASGSSADWNVSKDILVRGRVTGWFTNANPSGRARDDSNKNNVLPADRWVMPDDWVNIAGGALANTFRPSYDLMFDPDNAGLALGYPWGTVAGAAANQVATVAATSTGKGNSLSGVPLGTGPIVVSTNIQLVVGNTYYIGSTAVILCAVSGNNITVALTPLSSCAGVLGMLAAPAAGTPIFGALSGVPFIGPYSLVDIPGFAGVPGAALNNDGNGLATGQLYRDTTQGDLKVDWWDAPMPPAETTVSLSGTGFLKQVYKEDVYYNGPANTPPVALGGGQTYPNPYYYQNIPTSPYLPAVASGGGYSWDSWGGDGPYVVGAGCATSSFNPCNAGQGPYHFWQSVASFGDASLTATRLAELNAIRAAYGGNATNIALGFVVYSDNHGEFMVAANGDFRTDLTACATNVLAGGKQCKPGDKVGVGTISAVADYPDFVKHFPVASNAVTVNWTWGGYKDVTIEKGETDQYSYVVFHGMDRDGFCGVPPTGAVLLHSLYTPYDVLSPVGSGNTAALAALGNQVELVDFLIDSGSGIILSNSGLPYLYAGAGGAVSGERGNVIGVPTYSTAIETAYATGKKTFPVSALAASGQTDECQAWIKVSNSLLGVTNVLAIAHDDEGNIGFDKVIDFQSTMSYTLNFRWSLITWNGADNIPVADALKGGASTKNPAGNDISASVTAVYGWDQAAQQWLAFFPTGVNVPGANNLTALKDGSAYWIAITGPGSVTWTVSTNVS